MAIGMGGRGIACLGFSSCNYLACAMGLPTQNGSFLPSAVHQRFDGLDAIAFKVASGEQWTNSIGNDHNDAHIGAIGHRPEDGRGQRNGAALHGCATTTTTGGWITGQNARVDGNAVTNALTTRFNHHHTCRVMQAGAYNSMHAGPCSN